jgi:hypothetical protein
MRNKHLLWTQNNIITTLLLPLGHIPFTRISREAGGGGAVPNGWPTASMVGRGDTRSLQAARVVLLDEAGNGEDELGRPFPNPDRNFPFWGVRLRTLVIARAIPRLVLKVWSVAFFWPFMINLNCDDKSVGSHYSYLLSKVIRDININLVFL